MKNGLIEFGVDYLFELHYKKVLGNYYSLLKERMRTIVLNDVHADIAATILTLQFRDYVHDRGKDLDEADKSKLVGIIKKEAEEYFDSISCK